MSGEGMAQAWARIEALEDRLSLAEGVQTADQDHYRKRIEALEHVGGLSGAGYAHLMSRTDQLMERIKATEDSMKGCCAEEEWQSGMEERIEALGEETAGLRKGQKAWMEECLKMMARLAATDRVMEKQGEEIANLQEQLADLDFYNDKCCMSPTLSCDKASLGGKVDDLPPCLDCGAERNAIGECGAACDKRGTPEADFPHTVRLPRSVVEEIRNMMIRIGRGNFRNGVGTRITSRHILGVTQRALKEVE